MPVWQLIFSPGHLLSQWQIRTEKQKEEEDGAGSEISQQLNWMCTFLGLFPHKLLTQQDISRNMAMYCTVSLRGTMCSVRGTAAQAVDGLSRCGLEGLRGLMTRALLVLALCACSPHRLIFRHPKYSATYHQTATQKWQDFYKRKPP